MVCECKGRLFLQNKQANRKENAKKFYSTPRMASNNALTECKQNAENHLQNDTRISTPFSANQKRGASGIARHSDLFLSSRRFHPLDASIIKSHRVASSRSLRRFARNTAPFFQQHHGVFAPKQHQNSLFSGSDFPTALIISPKQNALRFRFLSACLSIAAKNAISAHCEMTKCK